MLNASMHRWRRFRDKIILLCDHIPDILADRILLKSCFGEDWELEERMRTRPVQHFRDLASRLSLDRPEDVLVLSSDADEIASGEAVWQLSHCEIRNSPNLTDSLVWFGTLMTKGSLTELHYLPDGNCSADEQPPSVCCADVVLYCVFVVCCVALRAV